jgi:hypothetical protein
MFTDCYFPGIRGPDFYDEETEAQLAMPEPAKPVEPASLPTFTPYPTLTPYPTPRPIPTPGLLDDQNAYARKREQQGQEYQAKREQQGQEYQEIREQQGEEYADLTKGQFDEYQDQMEEYGEAKETWKSSQEKAVRGAEGLIDQIYEQYESALEGEVEKGWLALVVISLVVLGLTMVFQKRKDVI